MFLQSSDDNNKNNNSMSALQPVRGWPSHQLCDDMYMAVIKITMERNFIYCRKRNPRKGNFL